MGGCGGGGAEGGCGDIGNGGDGCRVKRESGVNVRYILRTWKPIYQILCRELFVAISLYFR